MRALTLAAGVLASAFAQAAAAVTIDWTRVAAPGNAADDTGFGAVASSYRIARTEVTNAQYAEFLNAVADADPNGLYSTSSTAITRSGSSGSYVYGVAAGKDDQPVELVSYYDALRFANWLQNGQPLGAQGPATTESGAYTLTGPTSAGARNALAIVFLPSEDEWYKAAYFDPSLSVYHDYPTGSDTAPACVAPPGTAPAANCFPLSAPTDVGAYTGSPSPAGTFDQGGNVYEWTEGTSGPLQIARGGAWGSDVSQLASSSRFGLLPVQEQLRVGFRVASVPEPASALLLASGLALLGARRARRLST